MDNTLLLLVGILAIWYFTKGNKDKFTVESENDPELYLLTALMFNTYLPPDEKSKAEAWLNAMVLKPGDKVQEGTFAITQDNITKIKNILKKYADAYRAAGFSLPSNDNWVPF